MNLEEQIEYMQAGVDMGTGIGSGGGVFSFSVNAAKDILESLNDLQTLKKLFGEQLMEFETRKKIQELNPDLICKIERCLEQIKGDILFGKQKSASAGVFELIEKLRGNEQW